MSFQKCPKCDGTGRSYSSLSGNTSIECPVCKGAMIISELTGTPPKSFISAISEGKNVGKISKI